MLDGLGEALQLDASRLGPSRAVLHDYGNVSSRWERRGVRGACVRDHDITRFVCIV